MIIEVGRQYELPEGHAYQQPAMTVTVVNVKPGEWVAYENDRSNGCSRYDYFEQNAREAPAQS